MSGFYYLYDDTLHTENEIVRNYESHGFVAKELYFAALYIQKSYRGYITRKCIKKWHEAATVIQKMVRGWLVRYHLPDTMHEYYDQMCFNLYYKSAMKIQALWKGYTTRKEICYEDIVRERALIKAANEKMVDAFRRHSSVQYDSLDSSVVQKVLKMLFHRHHLLRTHQQKGIFSTHDCRELSEIEKILHSSKWKDYIDQIRKYYNRYSTKELPTRYTFEDKKLRKMEDLYRQRDTSHDLRDKDNLSIRQGTLNTKIERKPYERWLATTGEFAPAIKDIVRTEEKCKNISEKDFDLTVLKMVAKDTDVPTYYIDFWFENCQIHNIE